MKNIKSKGFTLIELLAIIVILAILALVATPQILKMLANARENTFKSELRDIVNIAEQAYANEVLIGGTGLIQTNGDDKYMCVSFQTLVDNGYMKKDTNAMKGYVLVYVQAGANANTNAKTYYMISANDKQFIYNGDVNNLEDTTLESADGTTAAEEPDKPDGVSGSLTCS